MPPSISWPSSPLPRAGAPSSTESPTGPSTGSSAGRAARRGFSARRGRHLWWGPVSRMDQVFKAYDVRGTVPDQLDADMCRAIGRAMARFVDAPQIVVVRDMRETGVALAAAFSDGV